MRQSAVDLRTDKLPLLSNKTTANYYFCFLQATTSVYSSIRQETLHERETIPLRSSINVKAMFTLNILNQ